MVPAVHHRTATVDGLQVFYREAGDPNAPAMVLLHGFPTSSHMFRHLIPALADRYHVVAPDHIGFGQSAMPSPQDFPYTFDALTEVTSGLLQQLGIDRFAMYVQDLTLETTRRQYVNGVADPSLVSPDNWLHDQALFDRPGNDGIQLKLFRDCPTNVDLHPKVHRYFRDSQVPLLAVWGANDEIFGSDGATAFRQDLPEAEIHLLESGHFALESHLDTITAHIRDFLARVLA
ncbi:alpha/beta fold hydrolase [Streptomyces sp. NPDC052301]|uniref:alpha/beta fold hydrolase n=1 Tax=Streptomyces sp. NPDC052301 TaxID=3365687 RepID=UPI0037CDAA90